MNNRKCKKTTTITTVTEEIIDNPELTEKTHIICILDRSGSMSSIIDDSIGGFNSFLKKQKELPDKATITVVLFDDKYDVLFSGVDINETKEITSDQWYPRGTTALYDTIGKTINDEKNKLNNLGNEKPNKVLVCIVTDGLENSSHEYSLDTIKKLISDCEKDDWNFIYLAANQDAFNVGTNFGISGANTHTYIPTSDGVFNMSSTLNNATVSYRGMSTSNKDDFKKMSKKLIDDDNDK